MSRPPYNEVQTEFRGIPFKIKVIRETHKAVRFLILGKNESQNVWIPKSCLNENYEPLYPLNFIWKSSMNKHKLFLAGILEKDVTHYSPGCNDLRTNYVRKNN